MYADDNAYCCRELVHRDAYIYNHLYDDVRRACPDKAVGRSYGIGSHIDNLCRGIDSVGR